MPTGSSSTVVIDSYVSSEESSVCSHSRWRVVQGKPILGATYKRNVGLKKSPIKIHRAIWHRSIYGMRRSSSRSSPRKRANATSRSRTAQPRTRVVLTHEHVIRRNLTIRGDNEASAWGGRAGWMIDTGKSAMKYAERRPTVVRVAHHGRALHVAEGVVCPDVRAGVRGSSGRLEVDTLAALYPTRQCAARPGMEGR